MVMPDGAIVPEPGAPGPEPPGPEPPGPEPPGPEPAGPESAGPEPAGHQPAGHQSAGPAVGPGVPAADRRERAWALRDLSLARSAVDRASHHRSDLAWIAAAWADEATKVLVLDHGQARINFTDGAAALE